jgi:hypothetical protein
MLKKTLIMTALFLGLSLSIPLDAKISWNYTGWITARDATSITVFDKEHVKLALDDHTTITHWIREKPYVRMTQYLTPSALRFGGLVRVRTRDGGRIADAIEVASDVKKTFSGRVVAFDDTSLSVYDEDMDVVTLKYGKATAFRELFTVKPFVRAAVVLSPSDLKIAALVTMYSSKTDPLIADRVEIAIAEPLRPVPNIE